VPPANPRTKQLFLVELWREPAAGGRPGPWRGVVKHVAHDDERFVVSLSDVSAFIAHSIGAVVPADEAGSGSDGIRTPPC
jgi:hypothetical protein